MKMNIVLTIEIWMKEKSLYLTELLPILMNSIGPRNDILEESIG